MKSRPRLRRSEWLLAGYFVYTSALALLLPLRPAIPAVTLAVNAAVFAGFAALAFGEALRGAEFFSIARDWYPMPLILLCYREMGWFAPARHTFVLEQGWIVWDRTLLYDWGLKAAIESLGPVLPAILEIAYVLVYTIPIGCMTILYLCRRRKLADAFLVAFLIGTLASYALFPYFPSEPPRTVFPGQDLPRYTSIFRAFNQGLVGGYGIHTSVFPSAHVSGAFIGAFTMLRLLRDKRRVGWLLLVLAVLIATATVYGRYHYAADAAAGFGIAVAAHVIAAAIERRSGLRRAGV